MTTAAKWEIRPYRSADAIAVLAIFQDAVRVTASKDYTPDQINAWTGDDHHNLADWDQALRNRRTYVACVKGEIAGFTDVDDNGYIAMMFVAPRYGRQGVATAMLDHLERAVRNSGAPELSANVSITARPFFEHHGFTVEAEQQQSIDGVHLTNFHMIKNLAC